MRIFFRSLFEVVSTFTGLSLEDLGFQCLEFLCRNSVAAKQQRSLTTVSR